jgi:hypothetical protein
MTKDFNFQGYKISNSHVRLGSKIHIQDFYYASRMFQHSYFANRFAILITRHIINLIHQQGLKGKKLVIVGYGKYSELLVVRVMKILELRNKVTELESVNYEIIGDTEIPSLLRQHKFSNQDRIIFLIPVGSTLSTGIKMRNFLLQNPQVVASNIIEPFINILLATDGELNEARLDLFRNNESDILSQYGWNNIDLEQKIINVNTLDNEGPIIIGNNSLHKNNNSIIKTSVNQKYFIALESKWHNIHNCELCFPHNPDTTEAEYAKEHPLIETDRASVTPQLILNDHFNFSGKELNLNKDENKIILDPAYHYYGHQFYGGNEHFHFIKPSEFLEKHYAQVEDWLNGINTKVSILHKAHGCKVTLIAPEGNLNSNFTSLINECIFSNTANIIQYNTKNDFVQNFIQLYQDIIKQSEYIFYVDDLVLTGSTFHASNNFIRQCLEGENKISKGFDAVIALITRADDFTIRHMARELNQSGGPSDKNIYAFKHLRIPPLIYSHLECPVCKQSNLYNEIAERCGLTTLRYLFFYKSYELKVRSFPTKTPLFTPLKYYLDVSYDYKGEQLDKKQVIDNVEIIEGLYKNQHLLKLVITDLLLRPEANEYFRGNNTFNDLVGHIHEKMRQYKNIVVVKPICKEILIKCITLPPFTYHKGVKETVFRWIIEETDHFMKNTILRRNGLLVSNKITDYFYLKLLLKRLSLLKSNYLLRKRTLENILKMYASGVEEFLQKKEARAEGRKHYLKQLATYLHAYQHLLNNPGKKSLEGTLAAITTKTFSSEDIHFMEKVLKSPSSAPPSLNYVHDLEAHIKYCLQGIQNIDTLNATLNGYQYFIVACVKEIIHNNEAKAIKLETNINTLYKSNKSQIDRITDFYHLLRIMKLENVGIFKQFLERIQDTSKNKPEKLLLQHIDFKFIEAQNKPSNYFLRPVFDLLQLENEFLHDDTKRTPYVFDQFMHVYRELTGSIADNSKLNTKVTSILNGVLSLMGLDPSIAYISLSVQATPALAGKYKAEALTTFTNKSHFIADISKNSFIPTMYGGITADINGPRQTFTELVCQQGDYTTLVDPLYDVEGNKLDKQTFKEFEETKRNKYNHLLFYRISDVTGQTDENISDIPVGVLFIAVQNPKTLDSWYFNCERLRYLLLLQGKLIAFIRHHILNDGFRAFLEETQKLHSLTTYRHGWNTYINQILKKVEKIEGNEDKKALLIPWIDLLLDQTRLARDLLVIQFIPDKMERLKRLELSKYTRERISSSSLKTILEEKLKLAYSHDNSKPYCIPTVEFNHFDQPDKEFIIYREIFSIIIHEIITNIIKYARNESKDQYIKFTLTETDGYSYLEVLNPFHEKSHSQYENRFSEGRGIKMILEIYRRVFDLQEVEIGPNEKDNTFLVRLPLNIED